MPATAYSPSAVMATVVTGVFVSKVSTWRVAGRSRSGVKMLSKTHTWPRMRFALRVSAPTTLYTERFAGVGGTVLFWLRATAVKRLTLVSVALIWYLNSWRGGCCSKLFW